MTMREKAKQEIFPLAFTSALLFFLPKTFQLKVNKLFINENYYK